MILSRRMGVLQRVDNNGWRPLSEHVLVDIDPITQMTAAKVVLFVCPSFLCIPLEVDRTWWACCLLKYSYPSW